MLKRRDKNRLLLYLMQNLDHSGQPFLVTLNPPNPPQDPILIWHTSHPIPSLASVTASRQMSTIQGKRGIWFCGAYEGYGFHEDGLKVDKYAMSPAAAYNTYYVS